MRLKLQFYVNANRAGKYLANRLKRVRSKARVSHLIHPTLTHRLINPQDIANQFADYYGAIDNLREDPKIPQPTSEDIKNFLKQLHLPTLSEYHLQSLIHIPRNRKGHTIAT